MTGYTCPAEGCDYGATEEKTKGSVAAHINATSDDEHKDKSGLRQQLEQQQPAAGDDSDPEAGENGLQATDAPESEPDEAAETSEDSDPEDMATDAEYQAQQADSDGEPSDSGGSDSDDSEGRSGAEAAAAGGLLAGSVAGISPVVLVSVVGLALLVYLITTSDGGGDPSIETTDATSGDGSTGDAGSEPSGGLVNA